MNFLVFFACAVDGVKAWARQGITDNVERWRRYEISEVEPANRESAQYKVGGNDSYQEYLVLFITENVKCCRRYEIRKHEENRFNTK